MKLNGVFKTFVFFVLFLSGCASSKLIVKSDPLTADVFILDGKNSERKPLGKTPLEMPIEDLMKNISSETTAGEFYTIVIEKPGFETQTLSFPTAKFTTRVTAVEVKLKEGQTQKEIRFAKEIIDHLFLAQRFANSGQFERAHIELDKILTPVPTFARALSMRASVYFAQKNYNDSLKWYEEALKNEPDMEEAVKMSAKVRTLLGRSPASTSATTTSPTTSTPAATSSPATEPAKK
jgi:tetratricopeptide (TPR) repeat protein